MSSQNDAFDEVQLSLIDEDPGIRVRGGLELAETAPIAQVLVEGQGPHLAVPYDYAVPAKFDAEVRPGIRVRVKFAGKLVSGFVLSRTETTEHTGELAPIERITTTLQVLRPELLQLCEALATRYAGSLNDVLRLAIPPRHSSTEKALLTQAPDIDETALATARASALAHVGEPEVPGEDEFLKALAGWGEGQGPRAAYSVVNGRDPGLAWIHAGIRATTRALAAGRSVLWVVPDNTDVARVLTELGELRSFAVPLSADQGQAARWGAWVKALTGRTRLVIGTRAAAYAPLTDLGLIVCFDDSNDSFVEPNSPYCHARAVLLERIRQSQCAALFLDYARSADIARLVHVGWLGEVHVTRTERRTLCPAVVQPGQARGLEDYSQLPSSAFDMMRTALDRNARPGARGPVLVQVPRTGYITLLACTRCGTPAHCPQCSAPLHAASLDGPYACRRCSYLATLFECNTCHGNQLRSAAKGLELIHRELGRAFPGIKVLRSGAGHILDSVGAEPAIVVATTGAEPIAAGGYAAAILVDTLWPGPGLRGTDRSIQRRLTAAGLVKPASAQGRVLLLDEDPHVIATVTQWQPEKWASEQYSDRLALGLPPACRVVEMTGQRIDVHSTIELLEQHSDIRIFEQRYGMPRSRFARPAPTGITDVLDFEVADDSTVTAVLGVSYREGPAVTTRLAELVTGRNLKKQARVRVRIDDPDAL